jgi:hypothetical protein
VELFGNKTRVCQEVPSPTSLIFCREDSYGR